ncbi:MAG: hypothetical protein AVDCRST_MAG11-867, partial [uncultured Gemmatimonadaceae bacterium]
GKEAQGRRHHPRLPDHQVVRAGGDGDLVRGAVGGRAQDLPEAVQVAGADGRVVRAVRRLPAGDREPAARREGRALRRAAGGRVRGAVGRAVLLPGDRVRRERRRPRAAVRRGARRARRVGRVAAARRGGVGAPRDVGEGADGRRRRAARVQDRARRPQAAQRVPDQGPVDRLGVPAQADRHGLLGARGQARALARLPGLRRLRQLPVARARHARRDAGAGVRRVHLRADALRAARRRPPVLARRPGRVRRARARARGQAPDARRRGAGAGDERGGERGAAPVPLARPRPPAHRGR